MLKKTIKYQDFNGDVVTEDFYFNLTKAEVAEMEVSRTTLDPDGKTSGGMQKLLQDVVSSGSGARIMEIFKMLISKSYGRKSEDGKRFIKSEDISEEFMQTAAYSEFFMELITDPDAAANFVREMMPADLVATEVPKPTPAAEVIAKQSN